MDPITLIVSALAAGAAAGAGGVATQAIQDAYNGLKSLITRKFAGKGGVQNAVATLETKPDSPSRQGVLAEELQAAGAGQDQELAVLAQKLLDLVGQAGLGGSRYTATLTGSGTIAQGPGAVAAGQGGVAVGGSVQGNIVTGNRNVIGSSAAPGQSAVSAAMTPEAQISALEAQLAARRQVLAALEQQKVLALGAEAARLDVLIAQERQEIKRLEGQLDESKSG